MRGIIILEGADGTGKTTLARHLVDNHGAFYIHNGLWPNIWQRHLAAVDLAIKKSKTQLVVIDRLWISEQIYGQVFRSGPAYDLGARSLDRVLQRHGALTVLCVRKNLFKHLAHFEKLKTERPEKFNSVREVAERFLDLANGNIARPGNYYVNQLTRFQDYGSRTDVEIYDMDSKGHLLDIVCRGLLAQVELCRTMALPNQFDGTRPNMSGCPATAHHLFVGDLSPISCTRAAPFLCGDDLSVVNYLNRQLRDLQFDETVGLWTNAIAVDDWLPELSRLSLNVIALGRRAESRVREAGFKNWTTISQWELTAKEHRKLLSQALKG